MSYVLPSYGREPTSNTWTQLGDILVASPNTKTPTPSIMASLSLCYCPFATSTLSSEPEICHSSLQN